MSAVHSAIDKLRSKADLRPGRSQGKDPASFDKKELAKGTKVEYEHTRKTEVAKEIAKDHLAERPDYYKKLKRLEDSPVEKTAVVAAFFDELEKIAEAVAVEQAKQRHSVRSARQLMKTLKPGDILFTAPHRKRSGGFMGKVFKPLSRKIQGTDFGHTAMYVGDGKIVDTRIEREAKAEPLDKLIRKNNVVAVRPKGVTPTERKKAVEYAKSAIGTPYSKRALLRAATPFQGKFKGKGPEKSKSLMCSGLAANAYSKRKFAPVSRKYIRPSQILSSKQVTPVAYFETAPQPGIEKTAIIGSMALGAGLHMGANAGFKTFRNSHAGHEFEANQIASGYRQAIAGKKVNPVVRNVATFGVGPEVMVNYDLGQGLGGQMKDMSKGKRYRTLKKLRKNVAMTTHVKEAPVGKSIVPAVNRILDGRTGIMDKMPTVASNAAPTMGQKALSAGLGAAAVAAEPHAAIHMGINATRRAVATSSKGKEFMRDQFVNGVRRGGVSKAVSAATDLAVSPAALDTRRLGAAMAKEHAANPRLARRVAASLGGQAYQMPAAKAAVGKAAPGLLARFGKMLPKLAQ